MAENIAQINAEGALVDNPKLEQVFLSIEKQLIAQTGFLKSMQSLQSNQFKFDRDMAKKEQSERSRDLVSVEDGPGDTPSRIAQPNNDKLDKDGTSGIFSSLMSAIVGALGGLTIAGITAALIKKSIPAILAPVIGAFINGVVTQALTELGATKETAKLIGDAAETGVTWGIWGRLLFGKWGGFAGLLAGIGSHLGTIMDANQDNIIAGMLLGIAGAEWWNEWGGTIGASVAVLLALFAKRLGIIIKTMTAAAFAAALAAISGSKPTTPPTPGAPGTSAPGGTVPGAPGTSAPGAPGTSAPGAPGTSAPGGTVPGAPGGATPGSPPAGTRQKPGTPPPTPKPTTYKPDQFKVPGMDMRPGPAPSSPIPSATSIKSDGRVGPQSIQDIVDELKKRDMAKYTKYAKFFKLAGPAASVGLSLIEPAMAIYNGESEDEIKRKIGIALGSVSGAVLGGALGVAGISMVPGLNLTGLAQLGAGALGAGAGAISGGYIAEKLTDFLMNKTSTNTSEVDANPMYDPNMMTGISDAGGPASSLGGTLAMLNPTTPSRIAPAESMGNRASAVAGLSTATIASGVGAGEVKVNNNMGGNVSNNTNVGGSSTTYNVFQSSGSGALSNSLPVPMTA